MIRDYHDLLVKSYHNDYNEALKPLLALVEVAYEKHPSSILNEIRAFNDHIARCYRPSTDKKSIEENLDKAYGHLKRAILDCLKYLSVWYHDKLEDFERIYRKVDLTTINNGNFINEYIAKKQIAIKTMREARVKETLDPKKAFDLYQDGYYAYVEVDEYLDQNLKNLKWAENRFFCNKVAAFIIWLVTLILGAVLGVIGTAIFS